MATYRTSFLEDPCRCAHDMLIVRGPPTLNLRNIEESDRVIGTRARPRFPIGDTNRAPVIPGCSCSEGEPLIRLSPDTSVCDTTMHRFILVRERFEA